MGEKVKTFKLSATSNDVGWILISNDQMGGISPRRVLAVRADTCFASMFAGGYTLAVILFYTESGNVITINNRTTTLTIFYI